MLHPEDLGLGSGFCNKTTHSSGSFRFFSGSAINISVPHNVRNWRHNTQDSLYTEYNYRIYRNLTYLSESWRIQILAEKQHHLKAMVKKFENEWPDSSSKEQSRGKNRPFTSLEMK